MNFKYQHIRLCILAASTMTLSACTIFMDMSLEGRHKIWLEIYRDSAIGKSIYECKARNVRTQACAVFKGSDTPLSSKRLPNGNTEDEYDHSLFLLPSSRCRYFYEYVPDTGLIVGFRFEEAQQYACRISGV